MIRSDFGDDFCDCFPGHIGIEDISSNLEFPIVAMFDHKLFKMFLVRDNIFLIEQFHHIIVRHSSANFNKYRIWGWLFCLFFQGADFIF